MWYEPYQGKILEFEQEQCEYSDGTAGYLTLDDYGALTLHGDIDDARFHDSTTLGTAHNETVVFENINEFLVPTNTVINSLGKTIIYAKRIVIEGTLNGNGGGYRGGWQGSAGTSPVSGGNGRPGKSISGHNTGGGGAGHGTSFNYIDLFE